MSQTPEPPETEFARYTRLYARVAAGASALRRALEAWGPDGRCPACKRRARADAVKHGCRACGYRGV